MKSFSHFASLAARLGRTFLEQPWASSILLKNIPAHLDAFKRATTQSYEPADAPADPEPIPQNPVRAYFENHREGPGIWKWDHYFEIYHRHLAKFVGKPAVMAEVGIYSGGSLPMWRSYFGPSMEVHGIDIEDACRVYEAEGIHVHIGDQADRTFWADFRRKVPQLDILIDDGGHTPEQQRITFEEVFPYLKPGGVFICEDIHGRHNAFANYFSGYCDAFNFSEEADRPDLATNNFQRWCHSIHLYPFLLVVEKRAKPRPHLTNSRRGTQWQPFFERTSPPVE